MKHPVFTRVDIFIDVINHFFFKDRDINILQYFRTIKGSGKARIKND
jgi:hypothetical protein